jgi:hypothetical protein
VVASVLSELQHSSGASKRRILYAQPTGRQRFVANKTLEPL